MSENRIEVLAEKLIVNEIPEKVQMYLIVDFIIVSGRKRCNIDSI